MIEENRLAQLLAKFEPWGDGYVYHHDAATGGLPCTREELDALVADSSAIYRRVLRLMRIWVIASAITLAALSVTGLLELERWQQALVFLMPFPFALQRSWAAHRLPWTRLGRRTPVCPPRAAVASFWSRLEALPASLAMAMLALPTLLAWQVLKDGWQLATDAGYLPAMFAPALMAGLIAYAKSRR